MRDSVSLHDRGTPWENNRSSLYLILRWRRPPARKAENSIARSLSQVIHLITVCSLSFETPDVGKFTSRRRPTRITRLPVKVERQEGSIGSRHVSVRHKRVNVS